MEHINVKSSNIKSIFYDKENSSLYVKFIGDTVYQYFDVNVDLYNKMLNATSKGKFFFENIKNKYRFIKHAK